MKRNRLIFAAAASVAVAVGAYLAATNGGRTAGPGSVAVAPASPAATPSPRSEVAAAEGAAPPKTPSAASALAQVAPADPSALPSSHAAAESAPPASPVAAAPVAVPTEVVEAKPTERPVAVTVPAGGFVRANENGAAALDPAREAEAAAAPKAEPAQPFAATGTTAPLGAANGLADAPTVPAQPPAAPVTALDAAGEKLDNSMGYKPAETTRHSDVMSPDPVAPGDVGGAAVGALGKSGYRPGHAPPAIVGGEDGNTFANRPDALWQSVATAPTSTFSADVDTSSYSVMRRMLESGEVPPASAVRVEELVNYFDYDYLRPTDPATPFAPTVAMYPAPWNPAVQVLHVGVRAIDVAEGTAPPVNLVLLVDVSGSMAGEGRLPLVKSAFAMLVGQLRATDTLAIVSYASGSRVVLPPTPASDTGRILTALTGLRAGGSTAGAAGLATAYAIARERYQPGGVNRILLATDGDFNVGVSAPGGLAAYVASQRSSGVFLSVLGFGMGNLHDRTMQAIAQNGNGVAAYIDSISEARRVLVDQVTKTLIPVAKDVKFQLEFNPTRVRAYRQIGYETRALARQDFDNDRVDAGELGSGHEVTVLYEVQLTDPPPSQPLRYGSDDPPPSDRTSELAFLRLRYKLPTAETSALLERPITPKDMAASLDLTSTDVRFAAAVSAFARLLRHPDAARIAAAPGGLERFGLDDVIRIADGARGDDHSGTRAEFVGLVRTASALLNAGSPRQEAWPDQAGAVAFPP